MFVTQCSSVVRVRAQVRSDVAGMMRQGVASHWHVRVQIGTYSARIGPVRGWRREDGTYVKTHV